MSHKAYRFCLKLAPKIAVFSHINNMILQFENFLYIFNQFSFESRSVEFNDYHYEFEIFIN
jgi:hypothetical protein